jgi:hypothetical protein
VFLNHFTQFEQEDVHLSCPSSVQLPAPACMLAPPPDILHTFEVPVFPTVSPELTAKAEHPAILGVQQTLEEIL